MHTPRFEFLTLAAALSLTFACTDDGGGGSDDEVGETQTGSESDSSGTSAEGSSSEESGSSSSESGSESESEESTETETETESSSESEGESADTEGESADTEGESADTEGESSETTGEEEPESDIEVVITSDNAYGFGYGTESAMANYYGGIENTTAGQIFNCNGGPETYQIPAEAADNASYLYIVTWADSSTTQGVIARFRRDGGLMGFGEDVLTGDEGWEVCATGSNYNPGSGGPSLDVINTNIVDCNADALSPDTSSVGWVDDVGTEYGAVVFGEDNTTPYDGSAKAGNEFPLVCQDVMPEEAKWMWFNWDPANVVWPNQSPFLWPGGSNPDHQFLIFRLAADLIPDPQ
ncbi:hypothetical protein G6O69_29880 [Pseudenhygromyxa sp. WMMC2535]|uniref:hypothetical protein n=1 Tax=Pseudenhygromyxa sp. WMMC2535 TaxID=2712867 RepID=UPI0015960577|nr:hypothetical protein [Pseudenhygromyxa sp. WMMC2535]NVB42070.1 hypothetical protein [Pseudenhygromyxa sp. WMMC2535]